MNLWSPSHFLFNLESHVSNSEYMKISRDRVQWTERQKRKGKGINKKKATQTIKCRERKGSLIYESHVSLHSRCPSLSHERVVVPRL